MQNGDEFFSENYCSSGSSSELELVIDEDTSQKHNCKSQNSAPEVQNIFDYDIESFTDKPWSKPGADITEYFNYGFNETTWKEYCSMQKRKGGIAPNFTEWNDGKYSGVRKGFSDVKRDMMEGKKEKIRRGGDEGPHGTGEGFRRDSRWTHCRKRDRTVGQQDERNTERMSRQYRGAEGMGRYGSSDVRRGR